MQKRLLGVVVLVVALVPGSIWAQSDAIRSEFSAAMRDAQASQVLGPIEVKLLDEAVLQLPQDYTFVPIPAASRLLKAMGNAPDAHLVGVIFPGHDEHWMMAVQFEKSGYIRDDDARDWNVDDLLRSVSDSTERGDAERRQLGFPEIEVLGWAEKPRYDAATHRLVWAIVARDRNGPVSPDQGVNYNTYALGRDGYFKLNLVTDLKDLAAQKSAADSILDSLQYVEGKRYTDFNAATDKAADFSLVALVAGIAAKKLGLLSVLGNAAIEYLKFIIIGGIVLLFLLGWVIFRRAGTKSGQSDTVVDDFPATIISENALDQATIPQPSPVSTVRPTISAEAASSPLGAASILVPTLAGAAVAAPAPRPLPVSVDPAASPPVGPPVSPPVSPPASPAVAVVSSPLPVGSPGATSASAPTLETAPARGPAGPPAEPPAVPSAPPIAPALTAPAVPVVPTAPAIAPAMVASVAAMAQEIPASPVAPPPVPSLTEPTEVPTPLIEAVNFAEQVPLVPDAPLVHPMAPDSDIPDVSEPEMVFTPRQSPQSAMALPGLAAEPMLIFAAAPRPPPSIDPPRPVAPPPAPSAEASAAAVSPIAPAEPQQAASDQPNPSEPPRE